MTATTAGPNDSARPDDVPSATETTSLLGDAAPARRSTSWKTEAAILGKGCVSLVIANLLQFSLNVSSMIILSSRGKIELGAASVATTTANITGFVVFQGLATSLDTLCAQAWGSGNVQLARLHVQRMTLLLGVSSLPIAALWFSSARLFSAILPNTETATLAGLYLSILVCAIPGYVTFEAGKRILTAQGVFLPITSILCAGAFTNAFLGWLLVWFLDFGFIGAPLAVAITWSLVPCYLVCYLAFTGRGGLWFDVSAKTWTGWGPILRLALPGLIMVEAEYLAFEILIIASAQLSTASLAAQTILATLNGAFWQIPFSISIAGTTMIAQHIGARSTEMAKISAVVTFLFALICSATNSTLFFTFRAFWPTIFTHDPEVVGLVEKTLPLVAAMQLFDGLAACCNGLLRGVGKQAFGGWVNLSCYYIVALPLSFWTTFVLHYDLSGLWIGVTLGLIIVTISEIVFLLRYDWKKSVEEADRRNCREPEP